MRRSNSVFQISNEQLLQNFQNEEDLKGKFFRKEKHLGKGAFANVYKISKVQTFAMKVYNQNKKEMLEQDLVEFKIMSQIKSKYLCQVKDSFFQKNEQKLCIVYELAQHGDLGKYCKLNFKEKRIPEDVLKQWLAQTALGLKELHSRNIIHRDIKPQNILVFDHDDVKIADYGLAKIVNEDTPLIQSVVGTISYMSYEMKQGLEYDFSTDIFSLGMTFIYLITNTIPNVTDQSENNIPEIAGYSVEFVHMLKTMINIKKEQRPTVDDILTSSLIADTQAIKDFRKFFQVGNLLESETLGRDKLTGNFNFDQGQNKRSDHKKNAQLQSNRFQFSQQKELNDRLQQDQSVQTLPLQIQPSYKLELENKQFDQIKIKQLNISQNIKQITMSTKHAKEKLPRTDLPMLEDKREERKKIMTPKVQQTKFSIENNTKQAGSALSSVVERNQQNIIHKDRTLSTRRYKNQEIKNQQEISLNNIEKMLKSYLEITKKIEERFKEIENEQKKLLSKPKNQINEDKSYQTILQVREILIGNMINANIISDAKDIIKRLKDENLRTCQSRETNQETDFSNYNTEQQTNSIESPINRDINIRLNNKSEFQDLSEIYENRKVKARKGFKKIDQQQNQKESKQQNIRKLIQRYALDKDIAQVLNLQYQKLKRNPSNITKQKPQNFQQFSQKNSNQVPTISSQTPLTLSSTKFKDYVSIHVNNGIMSSRNINQLNNLKQSANTGFRKEGSIKNNNLINKTINLHARQKSDTSYINSYSKVELRNNKVEGRSINRESGQNQSNIVISNFYEDQPIVQQSGKLKIESLISEVNQKPPQSTNFKREQQSGYQKFQDNIFYHDTASPKLEDFEVEYNISSFLKNRKV